MVKTEIIEVSKLDGQTLLGKFNVLRNDILDLKKHLQPKEPTEYQTRAEVAKMLSVTAVTVSEWTKKNILKSYKIGNRVFYKRNEVESALVEIKNPTT